MAMTAAQLAAYQFGEMPRELAQAFEVPVGQSIERNVVRQLGRALQAQQQWLLAELRDVESTVDVLERAGSDVSTLRAKVGFARGELKRLFSQ
jgi:hypothetical protein